METVEERLARLGVTLPSPPQAVAAYVPAVRVGNLCFTSGQLPVRQGQLMATGRVGDGVDMDQAVACARQAALNAISVAADVAGGVNRLLRVIKVVGFVQSAEEFHGQPQVINGASELLEQIFLDQGRHARSAVGANALPLDAPVEVECIFEVAADHGR